MLTFCKHAARTATAGRCPHRAEQPTPKRDPPLTGTNKQSTARHGGGAITRGDEQSRLAEPGSTVVSFTRFLGRRAPPPVPGPGPTVEVLMTDPTVQRSTTAVAVPIESLFSDDERAALVGFLAGYSGQTRAACTLDLRQYTSCAPPTGCTCSTPSVPTSSATPATWKRRAARGPPSHAGYAPSAGSTATPSSKTCSTTPPRPTYGRRGWTTNHTPPRWIATRSGRCWSPPGSARPPSTPSSRC